MSDLMAAVGSVVGDLVTGWVNNQYAEDRQNSAQNFSAEQYAKRYQTTVSDMKAAGLNPMLAYSQGAGSSPSGSSASSNATPSLGHSLNQGRVTSAQVENIEADTALKAAQADAAESQSRMTNAQASEAALRMVTGNENTRAQTAGIYSQITVNKANLPKIAQEIVTGGAQAGFYRAAARKSIADSQITEADLTRALNEAAMHATQYGKVRPYVKDAIGAVGGLKSISNPSRTVLHKRVPSNVPSKK